MPALVLGKQFPERKKRARGRGKGSRRGRAAAVPGGPSLFLVAKPSGHGHALQAVDASLLADPGFHPELHKSMGAAKRARQQVRAFTALSFLLTFFRGHGFSFGMGGCARECEFHRARTSWDMRRAASSQNFSDRSTPTAIRPMSFAALSVVPEPMKGSRIDLAGACLSAC